MADFLFGLPCVRQRRARIYLYNDSILIYNNQKLRTRYRFRRASIECKTNLMKADLGRKTNCYYVLKAIDQVLIALQFYANGGLLQAAYCKLSAIELEKTSPPFHYHSITRMPYWKQSQNLLTGNCFMGY